MIKQKVSFMITLLMPLCLMSCGFTNMVFYYFGLQAYDDLRRLLLIGILSILFGFSLLKLLILYRDHPKERKKIFLLLLIPAMWIIVYIVAIHRFGIRYQIISNLKSFGIYCIPAFIYAISLAIERTEETFIKAYKWYALIITPLMIYYVMRIMACTSFVYRLNELGKNLNYLTLGYTIVTILVFCILDFYLHPESKWLQAIIILLWIACIFTGGKGPLICMLIFLMVFIAYLFVQKQNKRIFWLLSLMLSILLFFIFIYSPPSSGLYRVNYLIKDFQNHSFQSSNMAEDDKEIVFNLAQNASPSKSIKEILRENNESSENNDEQKETTLNEDNFVYVKWDRMFLYKMALFEGNNAPLTGLGPMGYTLKYGMYPHNILLEIVSDFGYLIAIPFALIILFLIFILYQRGKNDRIVACMLLYIFSLIPAAMVSGTVYYSEGLFFFLGYAFASIDKNYIKTWKIKSDKENEYGGFTS
ncbi:MAG: O-antigen ligase family protein [Syntrophomonas sp.]